MLYTQRLGGVDVWRGKREKKGKGDRFIFSLRIEDYHVSAKPCLENPELKGKGDGKGDRFIFSLRIEDYHVSAKPCLENPEL